MSALQRVVVADRRVFPSPSAYQTTLEGIHHYEEDPVLGPFDRGDVIGKAIANRLKRSVVVHVESEGGGYCGTVEPDPEGSS